MTSREPPVAGSGRTRRTEPPEVATVDQPFDGDTLYALRSTLAAHANALGAPPAVVERLLIVASELATNAVRHGGGAGRLRLWRRGTALCCQVSDDGPGITDRGIGEIAPRPTAAGGRGMWICRQLCDTIVIDNGQRGARVTAVLSLVGRDVRPVTDGDRPRSSSNS